MATSFASRPNGQVILFLHFERGARHGPYRAWRDDGTPACLGHFENDREHGQWLWIDDQGQVAQQAVFQHGLLYNDDQPVLGEDLYDSSDLLAVGTSLDFDATPLAGVLRRIREHHGLDIRTTDDPTLQQLRFTGDFQQVPLGTALQILLVQHRLTANWEGAEIVVRPLPNTL